MYCLDSFLIIFCSDINILYISLVFLLNGSFLRVFLFLSLLDLIFIVFVCLELCFLLNIDFWYVFVGCGVGGRWWILGLKEVGGGGWIGLVWC